MALKTAVRKLWRWLPKSTEMQRAASVEAVDDGAVRVTQAAAWDPEVTAALERQGLALGEGGEAEGSDAGGDNTTSDPGK